MDVRQAVNIDQRLIDAMMADVMKTARARLQKGNTPYEKFKKKYWNDPVRFVKDCVIFTDGERPTFYQLGIMEELVEHKKVAVRGGRGSGKTCTAALVVLWFALTRDGLDWKALTTASVWRQVEKFLWPEIHKWSRKLRWSRIGRSPFDRSELMKMSLELFTGQAFGLASSDEGNVEGAHADYLLYIMDESKNIADRIWNSTEGAFSSPKTKEALCLAISTPGEPVGRFYEIHKKAPGLEDWFSRHITVADAIKANRISSEWVESKKALWGETSALYQNHVLGNFATSDDEGLIPIHWVEAANERYEAFTKGELKTTDQSVGIGIDIGRTRDQSVIVVRKGPVITDIHRLPTTDTMGTTGLILNYLRMNGLDAIEPTIDVAGIGAGVVDRLREQGFPVTAFHASSSTDFKDKSGELEFLNKRAASWWKLREALDPTSETPVAIPPDDILMREITAPHWKATSTGKIKIESKGDIRKRINRSTDSADALIMALYGAELEQTFSGGTVGVVEFPMRRVALV